MIYRMYRERLINLALSQFTWTGLPDTCNELYLERTLLFCGKACIARPKGLDFWVSLDFVNNGDGVDIYGFPKGIKAVSNNGACSPMDVDDYVLIYDNRTFSTLMPLIDAYAKQLWEVHQTYRSNLQQQITPYIVATNNNRRNGFKNFFNRFKGFEPVLYVENHVDLNEAIQTHDLRVDFKGTELSENIKFWWAEALSVLGITAETTKKERLISDEIQLNRMEDMISVNSRARNRVMSCNELNKKYGFDISVNLASQDLNPPGSDLMFDYSSEFLEENKSSVNPNKENDNEKKERE